MSFFLRQSLDSVQVVSTINPSSSHSYPSAPHLYLAIASLLIPFSIHGCSPAWKVSTLRSINATNQLVRSTWEEARPKLLAVCLNLGQTCARANIEREACLRYRSCQARVRSLATAVAGIHELTARAREFLAEDGLIDQEQAIELLQRIYRLSIESLKSLSDFSREPY